MTKNPIASQLDSARAEVDGLRHQLVRLSRQLEIALARQEAFEIAAKAFDDAAPKVKDGKIVVRRNRLPSADWQAVFQTVYRDYPDGFGYDEIYDAALGLGIDAKKPSLRTKLMNYANDQYVERIDNGRFAITRKGMAYFKIEAVYSPNENGAAEAAPEAGTEGVAAPYVPFSVSQASWTS
jgi:hypothetical protein